MNDVKEDSAATPLAHPQEHATPHGARRWLFSTNHKDIGTMYLVFACTMWFVGGLLAMGIRLELFRPGLQFFDPQFFNSLTTMHGLIMIFGAVMPGFTGLANWMIPLQIGAPDMALPRLNNFSFWLLPFAFIILLATFFVPGGAPAGGWTMYPPLSLQLGACFPMMVFAIHGFSGLALALVPADYQYQDTYFVVAHFHYVLVTGAIFAMQAAVYYWMPKWTGHCYDLKLATWHFWLSTLFVNVLFFPQHFLGLAGMPRRIPDYATQFTDWNMVSSIGGFGYGVSQLLFVYVIWRCVHAGALVGNRAWEGARGLEWELPSPPPHHSWTTPPSEQVIARGTAH